MLKSLLMAGSIALGAVAMTAGMTTGAEAKTNVGVYFGVPFYDYRVGPGWRYYDGYGWYDYTRYGDFDRHHRRHNVRSDFSIYFGVPFYSYRVGPGWRYYDGYGWYDYDRYGPFGPYYRDPYRDPYRGKLTCGQARRLVDRRGYDNVEPRNCSGRTYSFRATTKKGKRVTVYVNAYTGELRR